MAKSILTPFQKDVLELVSKNPIFTKNFYLTGGTALSEFYLHHRESEDLDFFSEEEFNFSQVQMLIKQIASKLKLTDVKYRNQFGLHIFFLHRKNEILKVDFNNYPFTQLEKQILFNKKLRIDSLRDIAVNKLQTIATQPRSRDFIDLYFIIKEKGWTIEELRKEARNKFDWYVDEIQLGSRFLMVRELKDYPKMIIPFDNKEMQEFWLKEANNLKDMLLK